MESNDMERNANLMKTQKNVEHRQIGLRQVIHNMKCINAPAPKPKPIPKQKETKQAKSKRKKPQQPATVKQHTFNTAK